MTSICLAVILALVSCHVAPDPPETTAKAENAETTKVQSTTPESTPEVTPVVTPEVNPETTEATPQTTEATPQTTEATPQTTEATPQTTEVTPQTTEATPQTTEATPQTTEATPQTTEATPETTAPETGHIVEIYNRSLFYEVVDAYRVKYPDLIDDSCSIEDYSISYYGRYGDAHVMFINAPMVEYPDALWSDRVGNQTFNYFSGQELEVYCNNVLYRLGEAYNLGLLTDDNLAALNERFTARAAIDVIGYNNLSDELAAEIKALYISKLSLDEPYLADQIWFSYYGMYGDAHVMFIDNPYVEYLDAIYEVVIGGQTFFYGSSHFIEVYCGGQLCSLEEAYELEFLTDADLANINEKYNNRLFIYKLSKYIVLH